MAFSVTQPSYRIMPSDNLAWSKAYSSLYSNSAFVYTFAVQVGDFGGALSTVATLRVPTIPGATAGEMAPNSILRNYVTTPVDFVNSVGGTASSEGLKASRVIYGTEYSSGGTTIAATGATGNTIPFWSAVFNNDEWVNFDANEWIIGPTSAGVRFLTDGPVVRCVLPQDLLYVNVGGTDPTYTKEEIFPVDSWDWPTYSGYPTFFDVFDSSANTLGGGVEMVWQGGATGFTLTGWPVPVTTGNSGVYARQMPTTVATGDAISIRIENAVGYGTFSTNYPRLTLVGATGPSGPWSFIGYLNVTITILPSGSFASFSGVSNGNYTYLGLQYRVTTTSQLDIPTLPGDVTTWTYTANERYYWNIVGGTGATGQYLMSNGKMNYLNVPQTAGEIGCDVYITDSVGNVLSEIITYDPDCQTCSPCELVTLTWLNSKGGYDTYRFRCVNNKSLEATRVIGQQTLPTTPTYNSRGLYNSSNIATVKSRINTNYTQAETVTWLESLFMSPSVYEVDDAGILSAVIVDNTSYQRFATPDRLMVVEFEITRSILRSSQIK